MKTAIRVGDIMTRNFVSVSPDSNLIECSRQMMKKRVGSLVLTENKKLLGLLTEKDIIWAISKKSKKDLSKIKARDIASKKVATIKPSADLYEALQRMKKLKFRRLPVITNGNVIGMLTLKDILRIEPTLFSDLGTLERIREENDKFNRLKTGTRKEDVCEQCGSFNSLYKVDNRMLCSSCKEAM